MTLPVWLFVLILLFAAVTAATHLLFPSVRWFFRRRAERAVAELNKRLQRPIQPFKLLRRPDMIQRVIYDPEVVRAVGTYAEANNVREDVGFEKAHDYAREIVPSFSATAYYGVAIRLARWLANKLFRVRLHRVDPEALDAIDPDATVVFVINHRSNFDYVLVTYLAAEQSALSYAVGEWARIWPLSRLIRAMGAYFIRRREGNALYRQVLASYVEKATEAGVTQAVFPEGGLSRTGRVSVPKLGILSYLVSAFESANREIVFVPVALNYDRVVEDRILVEAGRTGQRQFRATIPEGVIFTVRYVWRRLRRTDKRFGTAAVTFGRPLPLSALVEEGEEDFVGRLGARLMDAIREIMPVPLLPLIFAALQQKGGEATLDALSEEAEAIKGSLSSDVTRALPDKIDRAVVEEELEIPVMRGILTRNSDTYRVADSELIGFYVSSLGGDFDDMMQVPRPIARASEL